MIHKTIFSLTGMYSENPSDPAKRIEEFKNLVAAIHAHGMGCYLGCGLQSYSQDS